MDEGDSERRLKFDALFAAYGADIVSYCSWRAGSGDGQDAVAEVFLTAWRRLDDVPEDEAARVWLYATARRVIANQRRSNRRRVALQERLTVEAGFTTESSSTVDEEGELVREALRRIGPRDREVLLLAEWEGLSPAQIASIMGCLMVTARGRLHRARQRFRTAFEEVRSDDDGVPVHRHASQCVDVRTPRSVSLGPLPAIRGFAKEDR